MEMKNMIVKTNRNIKKIRFIYLMAQHKNLQFSMQRVGLIPGQELGIPHAAAKSLHAGVLKGAKIPQAATKTQQSHNRYQKEKEKKENPRKWINNTYKPNLNSNKMEG